MIIRVRSHVGVWRITVPNGSTTIGELRAKISEEHHVDLTNSNNAAQPLTLKPNAKGDQPPLPVAATLASLGLAHGDMLHLKLDSSEDGAFMAHEEASLGSKRINADGTIVKQSYEELSKKKGFRPGMMSLRSMKMKWTLNDFMAMDEQFVFKIKRQEKAVCTGVCLDTTSCNNFQEYVRQFNFHRTRVGYLYGRFDDENHKVTVEYIYEPLQHNTPEGFELVDDPLEAKVEAISSLLKLRRVGWIFAHPPREEGFTFSSAEIITAAGLQMEAANGIAETPFVTVKVTVDAEGAAHFDAFQVSLQCCEMVAEGAIDVGPNPGSCIVPEAFTAISEGKEVKEVDNSFFLAVVPIEQHDSDQFVNTFPRANREGILQTWDDVKIQLSKAGSQGFKYIDLIADFPLLLFLSEVLDMDTDIPKICASVVDRDVPLDDGFKLIINHSAGLES